MTVILELVSQGVTDLTRAAAFPPRETGGAEIGLVRDIRANAPAAWQHRAVWTSPARASRETAERLGLAAMADPALADLDPGRWAGRALHEVAASDPAALEGWMQDPAFCGHDGESRSDLSQRVAGFLERVAGEGRHAVAFTHAAVVRAAVLAVLNAPPQAFWLLDVPPLTVTALRHDGRRWSLRAANLPLK